MVCATATPQLTPQHEYNQGSNRTKNQPMNYRLKTERTKIIMNITPDNCYDYEEYKRMNSDIKCLLLMLMNDVCVGDTIEYKASFYLGEICYDLFLDFEEAVQTLGEENINKDIPKREGYLITDVQLVKLLSVSPLKTARRLAEFLIDTSETLREEITE